MSVKRKLRIDEEIESESDKSSDEAISNVEYEDEREEKLQKNLKLIDQVKSELKKRKVENETGAINKIFKCETLESKGKLFKTVKSNFKIDLKPKIILQKCRHIITCMAYSNNNLYTGSFDGSLMKWDILSGEFMIKVSGGINKIKHPYHKKKINCISAIKEYVATGDDDKKIFLWNADDLKLIKVLKRHLFPIKSLAFQFGTTRLYSSDSKGKILIWEMGLDYPIDELIGHTAEIEAIDSYIENSCISCSTLPENEIRLWKMDTETSLQFTLPKKHFEISLDCISMINNRYFVAGSFENCIYLFDSQTKRFPIDTVNNAHKYPEDVTLQTCNKVSIVSIASLRQTNVFASGSNMSEVRIWKIVQHDHLVIELYQILSNTIGVINDLKFNSSGTELAVVTSYKHKRRCMEKPLYKSKSKVLIFSCK